MWIALFQCKMCTCIILVLFRPQESLKHRASAGEGGRDGARVGGGGSETCDRYGALFEALGVEIVKRHLPVACSAQDPVCMTDSAGQQSSHRIALETFLSTKNFSIHRRVPWNLSVSESSRKRLSRWQGAVQTPPILDYGRVRTTRRAGRRLSAARYAVAAARESAAIRCDLGAKALAHISPRISRRVSIWSSRLSWCYDRALGE